MSSASDPRDFGYGRLIQDAVDNVCAEEGDAEIEQIVMDGCSTDETVSRSLALSTAPVTPCAGGQSWTGASPMR